MEDVYRVTSIAGGWAIEEGNCRMFLLRGTEKAYLVDTGLGGGDLRAVVERLVDTPVEVILTHNHSDHLGCLGQFEKAYIHAADYPEVLERHFELQLVPLNGGEIFEADGYTLEVICTPGHTPGSISLVDRFNRRIFSGDTISIRPVFQSLPGAELDQYIRSVRKQTELAESMDGKFYVCHGVSPLPADQGWEMLRCAEAIRDGQLKPVPYTAYDGSRQNLYILGKANILA